MDFGGRPELFRALVGSHNYNMNTPESDKDYKVFVSPTFDDLYFNKQFSRTYIGNIEDFDVHDIRKTSNLWWKANVNFVEVLFSEDIIIAENILPETKKLLEEMFFMKHDIAMMNLPYLFDACIGMHITKKKQVNKGTEGTQHLVDKFGYDTKQAMHSIRILDFLRRFSRVGFLSFKQAIWYNYEDPGRQYLLDVKGGKYSKDEYYEMADKIKNDVENNYKQLYKQQEPNKVTNERLLEIVKKIVKIQIL